MSQLFLTNYSVIVIQHVPKQGQKDLLYKLGNESLIRSQIFFAPNNLEGQLENHLFFVQTEVENSQFKMAIQFEEPILLRHKLSNKYLSYSTVIEDEQSDTTIKLQLSGAPSFFRFMPCFQYQTKISSKIKFNEDVYLATQLSSNKLGFVVIPPAESSEQIKPTLKLNFKSKLMLHCYSEIEQQQTGYFFGQSVWLKHVESKSFLQYHETVERGKVLFQQMDIQAEEQCIKGLWLIDALKTGIGGVLHFNQQFYLKNLGTNRYLTFSKEHKMVNGEKAFDSLLQERPSEDSRFIFESLKGEEGKIKQGSYLILKHVKSQTFVGTRTPKSKNEEEFSPLLTFAYFEDEDLYTLDKLNTSNEQVYRFIFSFRDELSYITKCLSGGRLAKKVVLEMLNLYENILSHLKKLSDSGSFYYIQQEIGPYMANFFQQLKLLRKMLIQMRQNSLIIAKLINKLYEIVKMLCKDFRANQNFFYENINAFIADIFLDYGAEGLIAEVFYNNYTLLCKLPNSLQQIGNKNIVNYLFERILSYNSQKDQIYWQRMLKIFSLLESLIVSSQSVIDINQKLISVQLFQKSVFDRLFFQIKAISRRIKIMHPIKRVWMELDQVREPLLLSIVQRIFKLFSLLCQNRNFISKSYVHNYLNEAKQNGVQIIITYLNIPISPNLSNNLYSLITNCYIDSSPRINRKKPLPVVIFNLGKTKKLTQDDDFEKSGRLQTALLSKTQFQYKVQAFQISNLLTSFQIEEPSLSAQQLDLYKEQLNERLASQSWTVDLLKSINILIQLQSYSIAEIAEIKDSLYSQIIKEQFPTQIIPYAMQILQQMNIYCQQLQIKKITTYLKYCFVQPSKNADISSKDVGFLLPGSRKLRKLLPAINPDNPSTNVVALQSEQMRYYRQEYNQVVEVLKKIYPKQQMKSYLFEMFTKSEKVGFSILKSIFSEIIRVNFPKLKMMKLLGKSIVITGPEVSTFQQLFELYKKVNHLTCISQHWLYSKTTTSNQHKHYIESIVQFTNYMFEDYQLNSKPHKHFRKAAKLNINRQLLLKNMALHEVILELLGSNYYVLEIKSLKLLDKKQRETFQQCFTFLFYFCQNCKENLCIVSKYIDIIEKYRNLLEVGQTKLLIMMYRQNQNLVRQTNLQVVQKTILKIVKNFKNSPTTAQCQYNPQYLQFLLTISHEKDKILTKNIEFIHSIIEKESVFKKLLFFTEQGSSLRLSLSLQNFKNDPLCVPILYHKKLFKIFNILIQHLESFGSQLRNKLKQYLSIEDLFKLLSLPDIYSHYGPLPQLYFLLKKQLIDLLLFYLDKNDSLNKLYESKNLQKLLDHFLSIFIVKPPKLNFKEQNESMMNPYLQQFRHEVRYDSENQRDYYTQSIHPLLSKLYFLFQKIPNGQNNVNFKKIKQILEGVVVSELNQNHLLKNINYGIDLVDLKWRNFVDADTDNSEEQKYAKKTILEFLRHQRTYSLVKKEEEAFYEEISQREQKYFAAMQKFIYLASEQEQQDSHQSQDLFYEIIKQLAEYLQWITIKGREFKGLQPKEIIETLVGYIARPTFDFNNEVQRETFYHILKIFVIFLENDEDENLPQVFYDYFKQESSSYRFFQCLSSSINQIFKRIEGEKVHQQINFALRQLSTCGQKKQTEIDKIALKFIKLLCKHIPFTNFFRNQPFPTVSTDFLEKLINVFYIMLKRNSNQSLFITICNVDIVEMILDCIQWMMNGCNEDNQNYLIDTKFPSVLVEILKKQVISPYENKSQASKRDILMEQVAAFYDSNGINLKDTLLKSIKYLDFKHVYLLNRLKLVMLRLLHQSTLANERGMSKIKIIVPIQLLKINLIWTFNDFMDEKLHYSQENILKNKEDWKSAVEKEDLKGTFLMVGFYFYFLIQQYKSENKQSKQDEQFQTAQDEEKEKEKVVKKFFSAIIEKEKKNQKMRNLQKGPFGKEMIQFYKRYYAAHSFYRSKTFAIEAQVYSKLIKVYFPILPICEKLTDDMKQKLIQQAKRISHEQKIKSLMQFQQKSYEIINGEQQFFQDIHEKSQALYFITKMVKNEDNFYLTIWIISCLIVLNYLLFDYISPSANFFTLLGKFLAPSSFLSAFMLLLQLISAFCGLILLLNLAAKKIPFNIKILKKRFQKVKEENEKQGKQDESQSLGFYIATNLLTSLFFDFYMIIFSFLTILHPIFSGFQLLYIVGRIQIGQLIIQAIKQTAFSLLAATGLLIIFNYVYSILIYVAFTYDVGYGGTCQSLFKCLLMVFDQSLKGDSGFLGYVERDDQYMVFTAKLFCQIFYILFVKKVIFQIFSGTIIDKFSELRQKSENTEKDEEANCFICGQERFEIDFELEGFEDHVNTNHNKFNYIYYLFYLRRKKATDYGIEQNYIWKLREKEKNQWIPDGTSLLKQQKSRQQSTEDQRNFQSQYEQFFQKKMQELKKIKQKMESLSTQLNDDNLLL